MAYASPIFQYSVKMSNDRVSIPSGMGGLVRYFDEYKSKIQLKPSHVIILAGAIVVIELFLHAFG